jgi:hypothetical protein
MKLRFFCALLPLLLLAGCDEDGDESPSQQALQQVEAARQDVKHANRLRDIDRLTCEAGKVELQSQTDTMRGLCIGLLVVVLAAMAWLGFEIRRRRILRAIISHQYGGDSNSPSPN